MKIFDLSKEHTFSNNMQVNLDQIYNNELMVNLKLNIESMEKIIMMKNR
jgi:hypothetical protein